MQDGRSAGRGRSRPSREGAAADAAPGRRVALAAFAVVALLVIAAGPTSARTGDRVPEVAGRAVVAPGDTLWGLAVAHAPQGTDPRAYLARIRALNDLDSAVVAPWTVVLLPAP